MEFASFSSSGRVIISTWHKKPYSYSSVRVKTVEEDKAIAVKSGLQTCSQF